MVAALRHAIGDWPGRPMSGDYSGGGAPRCDRRSRAEVDAVIRSPRTSAFRHGRVTTVPAARRLARSLATRGRSPGCEIHIGAEFDAVVPPALLRSAVDRRPGALLWIEPGADHACCWRSLGGHHGA
jgi:hypothetical protein